VSHCNTAQNLSRPLHKAYASSLVIVFNVTDSLLFLPSSKGFSARLAQTGFFPSPWFYFSMSHTDSPIVGASDMGQVSMYV
jgi:hypothetical protein